MKNFLAFTNRKLFCGYLNNHLLLQDPLMRRIEGSHIVPPGVILNHNREEFALILTRLNVHEYRLRDEFALLLARLNVNEYRLRVVIHLNHNREEFAPILTRLNVHEYRLRVVIHLNHNREEFAPILARFCKCS